MKQKPDKHVILHEIGQICRQYGSKSIEHFIVEKYLRKGFILAKGKI